MQVSDFTEDKAGQLVRNLNGDWAFLADALPGKIKWTDELASILSAGDRALGTLKGVGLRLGNVRLPLRLFLRREAELSSRIEGTRAGMREMVLFEQLESVEEEMPDVREVDNNFRALEYGLEQVKHRPVSLGLIREMHQMLMQAVRGGDKTPGKFRTVQAHIGRSDRIADARFVPAPPHAVQPAMEALEAYIRTPSALPPLVRVAMIHYQFEAIHPFADGNGRIGRVLILLLLCAEGALPLPLLNPSAFLERHRDEYYEHLLHVSQRGAWTDWGSFFARGVATEAADAIDRLDRLEKLRGRYQEKVQTARVSALLPKLIDELFVNPAVTTKRVGGLLKIKPSSAQKCIDKLLGAGILKEITGQKRNRVFIAPEILRAIGVVKRD